MEKKLNQRLSRIVDVKSILSFCAVVEVLKF